MSELPRVLMTGGGTGGHLMPALAVAERAMRERVFSTTIVQSGRAIEKAILDSHQVSQRECPPWNFELSGGLPGLWLGWKDAMASANTLLEETRPSCVVGLGGSASLPFVYAASQQMIPTVLLEQNVIPGWANQILWRMVSRVCVSFDETASYFRHHAKCVVTGNPLRQEISDLSLFPTHREAGLKTLLVLGGSQGAQHVNEAMEAALELLNLTGSGSEPRWRLHHQVGHQKREMIPRLTSVCEAAGMVPEVVDYIDEMGAAYREASVVVTRAGATTLAELSCLGLPAIIVPIPGSRRNHQVINARYFEKSGAAFVVEQQRTPALTAVNLARQMERLLGNEILRGTMSTRMKSLSHCTASQNVLGVIRSVLV
jgi:UDP-N-acetylglucosamine--N-acetylmuramyl-(pentapeptide) pyrophosphoryl-undecaprenol N-acetylglucosamine transferase